MATNNANNARNPLGVSDGGTGQSTLQANLTLIGGGTTPVTQFNIGTNGNLMGGFTGASPRFFAPTSPNLSFTFTNGTNTKNIDVTNWVSNGTWTPSLRFGGATTGITYSTQVGTYRRFGKMVYYTAIMVLTSKGSASGAATIATLPVAANSIGSGNIYFSNLTFTGLVFVQSPNGATLSLISQAGAGGAATTLTPTNFANNTTIIITGCYTTA